MGLSLFFHPIQPVNYPISMRRKARNNNTQKLMEKKFPDFLPGCVRSFAPQQFSNLSRQSLCHELVERLNGMPNKAERKNL
jgi:hypothetical protein